VGYDMNPRQAHLVMSSINNLHNTVSMASLAMID